MFYILLTQFLYEYENKNKYNEKIIKIIFHRKK
jgi:hypothetical protein